MEIRYDSNSPGEAVFGLVYSAFKNDFPDTQKQPVLQIPEEIRQMDNNLRYQPEYHLKSKDFLLLVGQHSFGVATRGEYCGWLDFFTTASRIFGQLRELDFIVSVNRLGLRYVNVFDFNILDRSNLRLLLGGERLDSGSSQIICQIPSGDYEHTLRVATGATVRSGQNVIGESVIDIDTSITGELPNFFETLDSVLNGAHQEEKKLFFSLISDDYLRELNPEFEEKVQ